MTARQKRIVGSLALANVVVIVALVVAMTRPVPDVPAPASAPSRTVFEETCRWYAARALAEAGGGGAVFLTSQGTLTFEVSHRLASGDPVDAAAQQVWVAFDAARALRGIDQCEDVSRIAVTIWALPPSASEQSAEHIHAAVGRADLEAFGAGELSEEELIDRVHYTVGAVP